MLEKLAGRLKWERTPLGMLVAIPVRRSMTAALYGPLVAIWLIYAWVHFWHLLAAPHSGGSAFTLQMIALGIYAVGLCYFVCWLLWIFTGETVLTLVPSELKIQRRVIGIKFASLSFPTHHVRNLRYNPPTRFWALGGYIDPKTSNMQFRADDATHRFARGITEAEASALTLHMLKIYKFPSSKVPGLVDV